VVRSLEHLRINVPTRSSSKLIWENWIVPIAFYAILWAGFRYWLEFTNPQSIVLAILFGSCYYGFKELRKKTEKADDFIPYRVSINIHNQRDLLLKFNLVKTDEDWNQLVEIDENSFLRRGLNFTVLSLTKEGLPHLIWWEDHKIFQAGIPSFEEAIQEVKLPYESALGRGGWSPRLYFGYRHGKAKGYTLALCLWKRWWEKNKPTEISQLETDEEHDTGSIYLVLGTLPYGEIGNDYEARGQDRKTELEKLGWTIKDYDEPGAPRAWAKLEVQNEYFAVSQQDCETD